MTSSKVLDRARRFIARGARLLDRRLFECRFDGGSPDAVLDALRPYQNEDGGFGNALEPDLRSPASQPIHCEIAFQVMREADVSDPDMIRRACDWLDSVATPGGAVAPTLEGASDWPCADHWKIHAWALAPAVNPTASIAAHLHALGATHPWLERATAWCLDELLRESYGSAHSLRAGLLLVSDHDELRERLLSQLADAEWYVEQTPIETYGVTPLHLAPEPDHPARGFWSDAVIKAHLAELAGKQEEDGGWPIHWQPPGPAAHAEWRGRWTLDAVFTLHAYGKI